jgi:hypothetical protein
VKILTKSIVLEGWVLYKIGVVLGPMHEFTTEKSIFAYQKIKIT